MKEAIFEIIAMVFLGLVFFFYEKPILSVACLAGFAFFCGIAVLLEDHKERRMFRK